MHEISQLIYHLEGTDIIRITNKSFESGNTLGDTKEQPERLEVIQSIQLEYFISEFFEDRDNLATTRSHLHHPGVIGCQEQLGTASHPGGVILLVA